MGVLLLHMPFASPILPSLAVELLAARLRQAEIPVDSFYGTLRFPRTPRIEALIHSIAGGAVFTPLVYRSHPAETVLDRFSECRRAISELSSNYRRFFEESPKEAPSTTAKDTDQDRNMVLREVRAHMSLAEDWLDRCLDEIPANRYSVYGFSVAFDAQRIASLAVAQRLKERQPGCKVVFGGTAVDGVMGEELLRAFPYVDVVSQGDADNRIVPLVHALLDETGLAAIPGLLFRMGRQVIQTSEARPPENLDDLPFPDYDSFISQLENSDWRDEQPMILFEASRGCWWGEKHHCRFCGLRADGLRYRRKSSFRVANEVEFLARRYPQHRALYSTDAILDYRATGELLPGLCRVHKRSPSKLFFEIKANVSWEQIALLACSGVTTVQPGIESLSDRVLRLMDKGNTVTGNIELLKNLASFRIAPVYGLIAGTPGETASDYEETLELVPYLYHLPPPTQVNFLQLDRFSPYFNDPGRYNIRDVEPEPVYQVIYPDNSIDFRNLVYRFQYNSPEQDDLPLRIAWSRLVNAVAEWRRRHETRGLWWLDQGARIVITETKGGTHTKHVLVGPAAELFRLCARPHKFDRITDLIPSVAHTPLLVCLERWRKRGWVYRFRSGIYLALAVELEPRFDAQLDGHTMDLDKSESSNLLSPSRLVAAEDTGSLR